MSARDVQVSIAVHDDNLLDIVISCPECGNSTNNFISADDFVEME